MEWWVIVPARAGSQGIPGKNLRLVNGVPLVSRTLDLAHAVAPPERIIVTTDDDAVADYASARRVWVHRRGPDLAGPLATLSEVVRAVGEHYDLAGQPVMLLQPTAAALTVEDLTRALASFLDSDEPIGSLTTVEVERHQMAYADPRVGLKWLLPRVNRQQQSDMLWRETGGVQAVRALDLTAEHPLIAEVHHLLDVAWPSSIDVDTPADLEAVRLAARTATVEWRVVAGGDVGLGHITRATTLAAESPHHAHRFVVDGPAEVIESLRSAGLVAIAAHGDQSFAYPPDVVCFDQLRVTMADVESARAVRARVVAFEVEDRADLTPGVAHFDLYVDELRWGGSPRPTDTDVLLGPEAVILRPDLMLAREAVLHDLADGRPPFVPGTVLVTFGGTDPQHYTLRVLEEAATAGILDSGWRAVIGPGFDREYARALRSTYPHIVTGPEVRMGTLMRRAHVVVSSAGRTAWEAAALGRRQVVIPVNDRERDANRRTPARAYRTGSTADAVLEVGRILDGWDGLLDPWMAALDQVDGRGAERFAWLLDGLIAGLI